MENSGKSTNPIIGNTKILVKMSTKRMFIFDDFFYIGWMEVQAEVSVNDSLMVLTSPTMEFGCFYCRLERVVWVSI